VAIAGADGDVFLDGVQTDVVGELIDLLSLEPLAVAEADHEVLDNLEEQDELISRLHGKLRELLPYVPTEDMQHDVVLSQIYHPVPYLDQILKHQPR
jgi:hypothetical protein